VYTEARTILRAVMTPTQIGIYRFGLTIQTFKAMYGRPVLHIHEHTRETIRTNSLKGIAKSEEVWMATKAGDMNVRHSSYCTECQYFMIKFASCILLTGSIDLLFLKLKWNCEFEIETRSHLNEVKKPLVT
jgi:hypothetical protein